MNCKIYDCGWNHGGDCTHKNPTIDIDGCDDNTQTYQEYERNLEEAVESYSNDTALVVHKEDLCSTCFRRLYLKESLFAKGNVTYRVKHDAWRDA